MLDNSFDYAFCVERIGENLKNTAKGYIKIGFFLWYVKKNELYKDGGYESIISFSKELFGFSKPSTYNFIKVCEVYSAHDENGEPSSFLAQEYKYFSYSQLAEMLGMSVEERSVVSPDQTVKEIRENKKNKKIALADCDEFAPLVQDEPEASMSGEENYESMSYGNAFSFAKDILALGLKDLTYERTIKVIKEAADYSAAFGKVMEYLNQGNYVLRLCLYRVGGDDDL